MPGLGWVVTQNGELPPINSHVLRNNVTNEKKHISTSTMPMTTKLGRVSNYLEDLL